MSRSTKISSDMDEHDKMKAEVKTRAFSRFPRRALLLHNTFKHCARSSCTLYSAARCTGAASFSTPHRVSTQPRLSHPAVIKDSLETMIQKEDRVIAAHLKSVCDAKYGPTWQCIVGEDFKTALCVGGGFWRRGLRARACHKPVLTPRPAVTPPTSTHDTKHFIFVETGKQSVLLWR